MKIIAFYLPQFHEIPENDKWWGKGFTEWTNTRKAKPLYIGHYQPKEPLNNNYYNLLNDEVREWQADLAQKYGIYGFCYYHYWFKGKQLLETPFNEVLKLKKPKLKFCLCWANEPWTRSWDGKRKQILIDQDYGDKKDWEEHFQYLINAFKDCRYIKINNKPVFLIYRTNNIKNCDLMIDYWNKRCLDNGFDGIYIIETLNSFQKEPVCKNSSAVVEFEPMLTLKYYMPFYFNILRLFKRLLRDFMKFKIYDIINYNYVWENIIKRKRIYNKETFLGAFVNWDNTARKGIKSTIIEGSNPEIFKNYLINQIKKSKKLYKSDYIFINAWNEWAEGNYLEPDTKYGFEYLKSIDEVIKLFSK